MARILMSIALGLALTTSAFADDEGPADPSSGPTEVVDAREIVPKCRSLRDSAAARGILCEKANLEFAQADVAHAQAPTAENLRRLRAAMKDLDRCPGLFMALCVHTFAFDD